MFVQGCIDPFALPDNYLLFIFTRRICAARPGRRNKVLSVILSGN